MKNRSLFWPFVLIAGGTLWLLISTSVVPLSNLWALARIWPALLIAAGVGLILQARWQVAGVVISAVVVTGVALAVIFASQLGLNQPSSWAFHSNFGGSVRGSGETASETRPVADFTVVRVEFPAEIVIEQGEETSLTVTAEDNLLPQLSTRVAGDVLYIENNELDWSQRVDPTRSVEIHITTPTLSEVKIISASELSVNHMQTDDLTISISEAGTVDLSDLEAGSLDLSLSGAGEISADGSAEDMSLHISGMGPFEGADLEVQTANVHISGAGEATLWAEDELDVEVSGAGSVSYYGSPSVDRNISGVSSIDALGER